MITEAQAARIIALLETIALNTMPPGAGMPRASAPPQDGTVRFGNYGRSKNQPVVGASVADLDYYRKGCMRTLDDASKSKWHDRERVLLVAIDAELSKTGNGHTTAPDFGEASDGDATF